MDQTTSTVLPQCNPSPLFIVYRIFRVFRDPFHKLSSLTAFPSTVGVVHVSFFICTPYPFFPLLLSYSCFHIDLRSFVPYIDVFVFESIHPGIVSARVLLQRYDSSATAVYPAIPHETLLQVVFRTLWSHIEFSRFIERVYSDICYIYSPSYVISSSFFYAET